MSSVADFSAPMDLGVDPGAGTGAEVDAAGVGVEGAFASPFVAGAGAPFSSMDGLGRVGVLGILIGSYFAPSNSEESEPSEGSFAST